MRIEAGVDAPEFDEAAQHQARSDEQHKRERHFGHHHDVAQDAGRLASGCARRRAGQRDVGPRARHAGAMPKMRRRRQAGRRCKSEHAPVDRDRVEARQIAGAMASSSRMPDRPGPGRAAYRPPRAAAPPPASGKQGANGRRPARRASRVHARAVRPAPAGGSRRWRRQSAAEISPRPSVRGARAGPPRPCAEHGLQLEGPVERGIALAKPGHQRVYRCCARSRLTPARSRAIAPIVMRLRCRLS